ncbi:MAG: sodium/solute symporter [Bacillota bacterium]
MIGTLDMVVFGIYFVAVIAIGLFTYRRVRGGSDFALAGQSLGWPVTIGTLVATMIGSSAAMGKAGTAYLYGIGIMWSPIAIFIGYILFSIFIAHKLRQSDVWTIPDVLEKRFGAGVRRLSAIVLILAVISIFGAQLIAMGIVFKLAGEPMGISYQAAILLAGLILVLYTVLGGMYAVAFTDLLQFAIMIPVIAIVMPLLVFGGGEITFAGMAAELEPRMFNIWTGVPFTLILGLLFTYIPGVIIDQSIWQRAMSAKNETVARWSPVISGGIYFYFSIVVVLLGMAGIFLYPNIVAEQGNADGVLPLLIAHYLPRGITGLGLTALFAVAMSTASTCLLVAAVIVSKDLVPAFSKKKLSEREELRISRIATLAIGLLGVVFALTFSGIFWIMLIAYGIFVAALFFPVVFALFWKKATKIAATVSIIASTVVLVIFLVIPTNLEAIIPAIITSFILMTVISLATYRKQNLTPPVLGSVEKRADTSA